MPQYELDLRDYWRVIRKRRFVIVSITVMITLFTFFISLIQQPAPIYRAMASVKVERSTSLTGLLTEVVSWSTWDTIATQSLVITSYPIMEKTLQRLKRIPANLTSEQIRSNSFLVNIISELQENVEAKQEEDTNIINIAVKSSDPEEAILLANTIAQVYKEESSRERNSQVTDTRKFIEAQLEIVGETLRESEEKLKMFQQQTGVLSDNSAVVETLTKEQSLLNEELQKIDTELAEAKNQLSILGKGENIEEDSGRIYTPDYYSHLYELNRELLTEILKYKALKEQFNPDYPALKDTKAQIAGIIFEMKKQINQKIYALTEKRRVLLSGNEKLSDSLFKTPEDFLQLQRVKREVEVNSELYTLLTTKHQEALIKEAEKIDEVSIVKPAFEKPEQVNPSNIFQKTLVGLLVGLGLGFVVALIIETLDTSIGTIEDLEHYLNVPVLGLIPDVRNEAILEEIAGSGPPRQVIDEEAADVYSKLVSHFAPTSILAESYRAMRTNIQFMLLEKEYKNIVVTSSSLGEGKTSVAINLSITLAQLGKKILLIESDLRKPRLHQVFGLDKEPGLTEIIIEDMPWKTVVKTVTDMMLGNLELEQLLHTPGLDNLSILTCGNLPPNPSEFLNSKKIGELLQEFNEYYDLVIIDVPPVLPVTDAVILGSKTDSVLLVYRAGKIARSGLKRAKTILDNVKANVIGIVLLGLRPEINPEYFKFGYKTYAEEGGKKARESFFEKLGDYIARFEKLFSPEGFKQFKEQFTAKNIWKFIILSLIMISLLLGLLWQPKGCERNNSELKSRGKVFDFFYRNEKK